MKDTLICVHTYAGNGARVASLMPYWQQHGQEVLVLSPAEELEYTDENGQEHVPGNDPSLTLDIPDVSFRSAGYAGWKGPHTIHRQIEHWKIAAEYEHDWYMMFDDDSLCLSADLPPYLYVDKNCFWSNEIGTHYLNYEPPYFFSREVLLMLIAAAEDPTPDAMRHVNTTIQQERGTLEKLMAAAEALRDMGDAERLVYQTTEQEFPYHQLMLILQNPDTIMRQLRDNIERESHPDWGGCNAIDGFYVAITLYLGLAHRSYPRGAHHYPAINAAQVVPRISEHGWDIFHGVKDRDTADQMATAYNLWSAGNVMEAFVDEERVSI